MSIQIDQSFVSQGFRIAAKLSVPDGLAPGERRPALIVLHGFGSNMSAANVSGPCEVFEGLGYCTLRFDMPGCGASEGPRGNLICLEQVQCTIDAFRHLREQAQVKGDAIAVVGSSFGGAVAIFAAANEPGFSGAISSGGWGHGERKFRGQHPTPEAWARFTAMLAEGRAHRERTGTSMLVPRNEIVPIPPGLKRQLVTGALDHFTAETAQSMFDFRAEDVVDRISPRPLLLLHSSVDSVTPTEQSLALFAKAGMPKDLHLFGDTNHFMFAEGNPRVWRVVGDWLHRYLPCKED